MSEQIQSIATGTYMIGETTQTELQAGPGISITKPSEGTVRIANDETVLWEGTPSTGNITLSGSLANFEEIRVYGKWHYNGSEDSGRGIEITSEQLVPTSAVSFQLFGMGVESLVNTSSTYLTCVDYRLDGNTLIRRSGIRVRRDGQNSSTTDTIEAYKVVGINRKENA